MARETMTNLISQLQIFMMAKNRFSGNNNWESVLSAINKYWEQAFYHCYHNIDKLLGYDKYFYCLGTIIR